MLLGDNPTTSTTTSKLCQTRETVSSSLPYLADSAAAAARFSRCRRLLTKRKTTRPRKLNRDMPATIITVSSGMYNADDRSIGSAHAHKQQQKISADNVPPRFSKRNYITISLPIRRGLSTRGMHYRKLDTVNVIN